MWRKLFPGLPHRLDWPDRLIAQREPSNFFNLLNHPVITTATNVSFARFGVIGKIMRDHTDMLRQASEKQVESVSIAKLDVTGHYGHSTIQQRMKIQQIIAGESVVHVGPMFIAADHHHLLARRRFAGARHPDDDYHDLFNFRFHKKNRMIIAAAVSPAIAPSPHQIKNCFMALLVSKLESHLRAARKFSRAGQSGRRCSRPDSNFDGERLLCKLRARWQNR